VPHPKGGRPWWHNPLSLLSERQCRTLSQVGKENEHKTVMCAKDPVPAAVERGLVLHDWRRFRPRFIGWKAAARLTVLNFSDQPACVDFIGPIQLSLLRSSLI
jgi:hypothetical protein